MAHILKADLLRILKGMGEISDDQRNSVACSLIGHSRIQSTYFGYYYCGRCGDQVGDSLGSIYPAASSVVIIGHKCEVCVSNYEKLTWKDKLFIEDPFAEVEV